MVEYDCTPETEVRGVLGGIPRVRVNVDLVVGKTSLSSIFIS